MSALPGLDAYLQPPDPCDCSDDCTCSVVFCDCGDTE